MAPRASSIGVGLLGASAIAPEAIVRPLARRTDAAAVAVGAARPGAAFRFAAEHRIPAAYDGYDAVLADPRVDVVYVGLAAAAHAEWVIAALRAGKHVICEKPLALDADEARELVATAERLGLVLLEAFHYRFHPLMGEVQRIVRTPGFGVLRSMTSVIDGSVPFSRESILHDPVRGGGALLHSGCYALHWMRTLAGSEAAVLQADARVNPLGADTTVTALLEFATGVTAHLTTSFDGITDGLPQLSVVGEHGHLEVNGLISPHHGHSLRFELQDGVSHVVTVAGRASFDHQLDALLRAVRGDTAAVHDDAGPIGNAALIDAILRETGVRET